MKRKSKSKKLSSDIFVALLRFQNSLISSLLLTVLQCMLKFVDVTSTIFK